MPDEPSQLDQQSSKARRLNIIIAVLTVLFVIPYILLRISVEFVQFNVVNYSSEPYYVEEKYWPTHFFGFIIFVAFMFLYAGAVSSYAASNRFRSIFCFLSP